MRWNRRQQHQQPRVWDLRFPLLIIPPFYFSIQPLLRWATCEPRFFDSNSEWRSESTHNYRHVSSHSHENSSDFPFFPTPLFPQLFLLPFNVLITSFLTIDDQLFLFRAVMYCIYSFTRFRLWTTTAPCCRFIQGVLPLLLQLARCWFPLTIIDRVGIQLWER